MTPTWTDSDNTVDAERAEIDAAWDETIHRRLAELISGAVAPVSGRETRAIARARLAARR